MPQNDATSWLGGLITGLSLLISAYVGRLTWHTREVRSGRRRFWSIDLALDLPTAAGMALLGYGASEYLDLTPGVSHALTGVLGYLGPRGTEILVAGWWRARAARDAAKG